MDPRKALVFVRLGLALTVLGWAAGHVVRAQSGEQADPSGRPRMQMRSTTQAQRQAAAEKKRKAGLTRLGAAAAGATGGSIAPAAAAPLPGATPDYFGPYSNWGLSPLPSGPIAAITIASGGTGYSLTPTVTISDVYGAAPVATTATVVAGVITAIAPPAGNFTAPVVNITDPTGVDASATATITPTSGGLHKFVDALPSLVLAVPDVVSFPGSDYYEIEVAEYTNWSFHADLPATRLRGYRQTNQGTNVYNPTSNPAGTCVPGGSLAPPLPDCTAAHNTVAPPAGFSFLGPTIVAVKDRPTRIKFTNNLPLTGAGGELFIPTDTTVMGAGMGYDPSTASTGPYPQNRATLHLHGGFTPWVSDGTPHQWVTPSGETGLTTGVSTQPVPDMDLPPGNSMTFYWPNQQSGRLMFYHDHAYGITRLNVYAGEAAGYLLVDPIERALTDGSTAGIPALPEIPLVIQDKTFVWGSQAAGTGTWATDPTWNWGQSTGSLWFPHVYMPNQNPWDIGGANAMGRWDYALWFWPPYTGLIAHPDVANPYYDPINAPWEPPRIPGTPNPSLVPEAFMDTPLVNGKAYPTLNVPAGPVRFRILNAANDRFQNLSLFIAADKTTPTTATTSGPSTRLCDGVSGALVANCTEVKMVPFNSSQNLLTPFPLWWYTPGLNFTFDDRTGGVPDPTTRGPALIQIGTEGGLLPAPALIRNQPVNYTYNRRDIVVLSVQEKALFLGPAERADVIVDFSKFAGRTLILYNDAPAPVPAADQRIDYYTGGPDLTDTGGAPPTLPGYGPNTRTVMQIVVGPGGDSSASVDGYDPALLAALNTALPAAFAASQDPIIVPQVAYNAAYPSSPTAADVPGSNVSRISDLSLTFTPLFSATALPLPLEPKAIQELFELDYGRLNSTLGVELKFTNGANQTTLPFGYIDPATELVNSSTTPAPPSAGDGTQIWKITHNGVDTHAVHFHLFNVQVINRVGWDGAIRRPDANELGWKETVRMNPLEDIIVALRPTTPKLPFGLPDSVRLLDVTTPPGTSGQFAPFGPDGNPVTTINDFFNFGWEYVWHCHLLGHEENDMMRPLVFSAPRAQPVAPAPLTLSSPPGNPLTLTWTDPTPFDYATGLPATTLGDPANEIGFRVEKVVLPAAPVVLGRTLANTQTFVDDAFTPPAPGTVLTYNVYAFNAAGDSLPASVSLNAAATEPAGLTATVVGPTQVDLAWVNPPALTGIDVYRNGTLLQSLGVVTAFSDTTAPEGTALSYYVIANSAGGPSGPSNVAAATTPLQAPASLTAAPNGPDQVDLAWTNTSSVATGIEIYRDGSLLTTLPVPPGTPAPNTYTDVGTPDGTLLGYHVVAVNTASRSAQSNTATTTTPLFPPTNLVWSSATATSITIRWTDPVTTATGFHVERAPGSSGGVFTLAGTVTPATTTVFVNTGLTKNTTYRYRVRAFKTAPALNSTYSNVLTVTTPKK